MRIYDASVLMFGGGDYDGWLLKWQLDTMENGEKTSQNPNVRYLLLCTLFYERFIFVIRSLEPKYFLDLLWRISRIIKIAQEPQNVYTNRFDWIKVYDSFFLWIWRKYDRKLSFNGGRRYTYCWYIQSHVLRE